jgi:SNF2 family DNA or RNA helicase
MLKLDKNALLKNFKKQENLDGLLILESGELKDFKVNIKDEEIHISGSVKDRYSTLNSISYVKIYKRYGFIELYTTCNCFKKSKCEHCVALLLNFFEDQKDLLKKAEINSWIDSFPTSNSKKSQDEYRIKYLIGKDENFEIIRQKLTAKGTWSQGARVKIGDFAYRFDSYEFDYLKDEDRVIASLIKGLMDSSWSSYFKLDGSVGYETIKRAVLTSRAHVDLSSEPLKFSDKKVELEFFLKRVAKGFSLKCSLDKDYIFYTKPMLYLNIKENTIQEIDTNLDIKTIKRLFKSPTIPVDMVDDVVEKVVQKIENINLDISSLKNSKKLDKLSKPRVRVYKNSAIVDFLYDNFYISYYPRATRFVKKIDKNFITVQKDLEKERRFANELNFLKQKRLDENLLFYEDFTTQSGLENWRIFLQDKLKELRESGWEVLFEDEMIEYEEVENIEVDTVESETSDWFELSFNVNIAGHEISLLPLVASLIKEFDNIDEIPPKINIMLKDGKCLHFDSKVVKPILMTIYELYDHIKDDKLVIKPYDAHLIDFDSNNLFFKGSLELKELSERLKKFEGISLIKPHESLKATLREYQIFGLSWLNFLYEFKFGGILADDMGLGKTIQVLSFLQKLKMEGKLDSLSLVVVPTSLLSNWHSEIEKFTPNLTAISLYGNRRKEIYEKINEQSFDLIITTYQIVQRDIDKLKDLKFKFIILDEAHKIKNPKAKMTLSVKSLNSEHRVALTGTPVENNLSELWSIFDFVMPGFFGTLSFFKAEYQNPIEKENSIKKMEKLQKRVSPFVLRRTKDEVLDELPEKIEIVRKVTFGKKQALLYENVRVAMEKKVRDEVAKKGLNRSQIMILDALLKLRQVCCDPSLLSISGAKDVKESAKKEEFFELLDELLEEGRKVLVFSQFKSMLEILENELIKRGINYSKLTGETRDREGAIEKFKSEGCSLFLISLKAGGVGLNLVEADTVIHYDPWWNPAAENQATDRAYRIGQTKTVFVYKLIVENSIEEKILKLQELKSSLQSGIYSKKESQKQIEADELLELLKG